MDDGDYFPSSSMGFLFMESQHKEVNSFVVINDCKDDLPMHFGKRFIHIKGIYGLTYKTTEKAIELLGAK